VATVLLEAACLSVPVGRVRADVMIASTIATKTATTDDRIQTVTYLKGPWMRRETAAQGGLADFIGRSLEIHNRVTGAWYRVYADLDEYALDTVTEPVCAVAAVLDFRLLGRIKAGNRGRVRVLDERREMLGCETRAVQVELDAGEHGGTTIRFWVADDLETLFGARQESDLFCAALVDRAAVDARLQARWQKQFRLSAADAAVFAAQMQGYPLLVESFAGPEDNPITTTRITTDSIRTARLSDSLFSPPGQFDRRGAPAGENN
jgi:hypothetical protein